MSALRSSRVPCVALLGALVALAPACVRKVEPPPETVGGFEVHVDFERAPSPGIVLATCPCPLPGCEQTDLCPGGPGDPNVEPDGVFIPFNDDQRVAQFYVDIVAVGTRGTKPFPLTGPVSISTSHGEVVGVTTRTNLTDGVAEDVLVRLRRTPGPTHIWVVDNLNRDDGAPPSWAVGTSDATLWFDQPSVADIQRTNDECCNPMQGQRVEVTDGELYVTRTTGNGFNVQDLRTPEWGGIFVFAFNGIEGLRVGTKLLALGGAVTEFQSSTQLTEPVYVPVNGLCGDVRGAGEGGQDTDEEETGIARARCPRGSECVRDEEGVERCTPDGDPGLDDFGRRVCTPGNDASCPTGMECKAIEGQGSFCQVRPLDMNPEAFPEAPYCGPIRTSNNLDIEALEGSLVRITGTGASGVRLEGLPVCKQPDGLEGQEALDAVRSLCNPLDFDDGEPRTDCAIAKNGEPLLKDLEGRYCFRGNQACRDNGRAPTEVRSSCFDNGDASIPRCQLAEPGDPVLVDGDPASGEAQVCRGTLDDFLMSGFTSFGQAKVYFEDAGGVTRCATVNFDGLTGFNPLEQQEQGVRWRSLTGTLRQVRFRSESGYWILDVRFPEDLEPL